MRCPRRHLSPPTGQGSSCELRAGITYCHYTWISGEWPDAIWHREYPIQHRLPSGTIVAGTIDLALELPDGWIIIDHKSYPGTDPTARAATYTGQLSTYAAPLSIATNCEVRNTIIHLPISSIAAIVS